MKYLGLLPRLILLALVVFLLTARAAHCTTGKQKPSPYPYNFVNPHEYSLGKVLELSTVHPTKGKTWTSLRWKPERSPLLYSESMLFCGDVTNMFAGITYDDELVLIFSRAVEVAREDNPPSIVACRNLEGIVQIRTKEEK